MSCLRKRESIGVEVDSRFRGNDSNSYRELKLDIDFPDGILISCLKFMLTILVCLPAFSIARFWRRCWMESCPRFEMRPAKRLTNPLPLWPSSRASCLYSFTGRAVGNFVFVLQSQLSLQPEADGI